MDKQKEDMSLEDRIEMIKAMYGVKSEELPDPDKAYAIFTDGNHAGREFKRVAKANYGLTKKVEKIRLKAKPMCFRLSLQTENDDYDKRVKEIKSRICEELGFDDEKDVKDELNTMAYHKALLPLICSESLPERWNMDDVSGYEVERMLQDFLAGT